MQVSPSQRRQTGNTARPPGRGDSPARAPPLGTAPSARGAGRPALVTRNRLPAFARVCGVGPLLASRADQAQPVSFSVCMCPFVYYRGTCGSAPWLLANLGPTLSHMTLTWVCPVHSQSDNYTSHVTAAPVSPTTAHCAQASLTNDDCCTSQFDHCTSQFDGTLTTELGSAQASLTTAQASLATAQASLTVL